MILWRISEFANLEGSGGLKYAARWHSAGHPVVYLADHLASSILEIIVHTEVAFFPATLQYLMVETNGVKFIKPKLPSFWKEDQFFTRQIGDQWLKEKSSALLKIPSAITPHAWNYVLNPVHSDAKILSIIEKGRFPVDNRLL